ncbi:MAG: glycosyltransferase [Patescibacteria group bacterium]
MERGENKLKILFLITKSNFGGAQRYVFDLATHLPKEQFESVVALGGSGALKEKLETEDIETITIPGLERDIHVLKEIHVFISIFKIIRGVKPDIIHLNSSKAGALGALAARFYTLFLKLFPLRGISRRETTKVIFTVHGFAFKEKRKPMTKKIIEYVSWLTLALSHQTIVVSKDDQKKASQFLFVQSKITLIYNGIDSPTFKDRVEARKILSDKIGAKISEETLWVGSIAELHKNKGLEYGISALTLIKRQGITGNKISNLAYIIIGAGEEKENLKMMIQREGLSEKIFLPGGYAGAAELLKAFDIFLLPSLKEGLPYALLEAGSAGLPTIGTNVGGISEVIHDMKSGIVVKEKRPKEIADALTFLSDNEQKRKEFGERILQTIQTEYTLDRMVKETIEVYKKI